jgi:hypothetical protein
MHVGGPPSATVGPQAMLHTPQLFGSLPVTFTQAGAPPPVGVQGVVPDGHPQAPPVQVVAPVGEPAVGQTFPQPPQLLGSVVSFVQALPQKFGVAMGQQVVPLQV